MAITRSARPVSIGVFLLLLLPAVAEGATVRTSSETGRSSVAYVADPGEVDAVSISLAGRLALEFRSSATPVEAGRGCREVSATVARCRIPEPEPIDLPGIPGDLVNLLGNVRLDIALGDGDDSVDASALPGTVRFGKERTALLPRLRGEDGNDAIAGGGGDDEIVDGPGDDYVTGGPGDDSQEGGRAPNGADLFDGGAGEDQVIYYRRKESVSVSFDGVSNDGAEGEGDSIGSASLIFGSADDDHLVGGAGDEFLIGSGGTDVLEGGDGEDILYADFAVQGGAGDDRVEGGGGDDYIAGGQGRDVLFGGDGSDEIDAASVDLAQNGNDGRDRADCGPGKDEAIAQRKDRLAGCENVRRFG